MHARNAVFLALLATSLGCNREKRARSHLENEGFTDVVLTKSGNAFTFTAKNAAGQRCTGDVRIAMGTISETSICNDVCTKTDTKACFSLGLKNATSNPTEAINDYVIGCEAGDVSSCVNAGVMYDKGSGIPKDPDKSFVYDKKACDGGDAQGCLNVAIDYEGGLGTPKDLDAAFRAGDLACTKKLMKACAFSGRALVLGRGVPRDVIGGLDRLERACSSGDANGACTNLGVYLIDGRNGITRDVARGQKILDETCTKGEALACFNLGHYAGMKTLKLPGGDTEMVGLLTKACDKNEGAGCNELGFLTERGQAGLTRDLTAALAFYQKGCDHDDDTACRNAGLFHEKGVGAAKDLTAAAAAYDKCCAAGNDECCSKRKALPPQ